MLLRKVVELYLGHLDSWLLLLGLQMMVVNALIVQIDALGVEITIHGANRMQVGVRARDASFELRQLQLLILHHLVLLVIVAGPVGHIFKLIVDYLHLVVGSSIVRHCIRPIRLTCRYRPRLRNRRRLLGGGDADPPALLLLPAPHEVAAIFILVSVVLVWRGASIVVVVGLVVEAL